MRKKADIPNNPFAKKIAKLLKYNTENYDKNVEWLSREAGFSPYTIKSWLNSQAKVPHLKNIKIIARIYGINDLSELLAEKENDSLSVSKKSIEPLEKVINEVMPLFGGKFINLDKLPEIKKKIIAEILSFETDEALRGIDQAVQLNKNYEQKIKKISEGTEKKDPT